MAVVGPIYTTPESVKLRLTNKVQFQADPNVVEDGELPNTLFCQLIADAETEVEQDLRSRYTIPFQSLRTGKFADLPDHSKRALRTACDLRAVMMVLEIDFGRGTHVDAKSYFDNVKEHYESYIGKLLGRDQEGANDKIDRFRRAPPLDDVKLALSNSQADDGYRGRIINTDASTHDSATYAGRQINDPANTYSYRRFWGF